MGVGALVGSGVGVGALVAVAVGAASVHCAAARNYMQQTGSLLGKALKIFAFADIIA